MNKNKLELMNDGWNNYLQLTCDEGEGLETTNSIYFMDKSELASYVVNNIDVENDTCFGVEDGEPLLIETDVCYLPATYASNNPVFITTDDYYLLDRFGYLEKAAELISECLNKEGE